MTPGNTLNTRREQINTYINKNQPIVVSANFVAEDPNIYVFFEDQKRYARLVAKRIGRNVIIPSNVKADNDGDLVVNCRNLINRGYRYFENSTTMPLNMLKRVSPRKIVIVGFDGFSEENEKNYFDNSFQNDRHISGFSVLNKEIVQMYGEIKETVYSECIIKLLTPSLYEDEE